MNFRPIFYINGILLLILSAAMLLPTLIDLSEGSDDWKVFASAQIITAFAGFCLLFSNQQKKFHMTLKETFLLTSLSWVMLAAFAALPFCFSVLRLDYTQAFFEAMSGITTTGSTVITGLDNLPQGVLLWRCMLHWLGGIGFLIIALAVLPLLQISGMQIYKSQSFGEIDKVLPSASQMAIVIMCIYIVLTIAATVAFHFAGMSLFDAFCHAMSAVSTGGFANYDSSLGYYRSPVIEWIAIFFMLAGALPFVLYLRMLRGDRHALVKDSQVRAFLGIVCVTTLMMIAYLVLTGRYYPLDALRSAFFMVVTIITTAGLVHTDYTAWGSFAIAIAFMLTFMGSCSGSTSGGIKVFRLQILWAMMMQQLNKLMKPHGIFQVHYNRKIVEPSLQAAIAGFFFVYILLWGVFGVALQLCGLDFMTAFSAAATALSNAGVGLGHTIGPAGNFSSLPDSTLWIISLAMLMGRLEFFTLLVILTPRFWRD